MGRVARDRSLSLNHWVTDKPNFRVYPVKRDFYFPFLTRTPSSMTFWVEMKFPLTLQGEFIVWNKSRENIKQTKVFCVEIFVWIRGSEEGFLCFSFANKRGLPPNNLYIAFLVIFLLIAYCLHGSIPRQINIGFHSFAMQVISIRNVLKGSLSLSLKLSFNPLKWSWGSYNCCWL